MLAIGLFVFVVAIFVPACVFLFQSRILFYPARLAADYTFNFTLPVEELYISYGNGKKVHALLFKPENPLGRILYIHGNRGALDTWGATAQELAKKLNCEVLIFDYPGFGKSGGALARNEVAMFESAAAAFRELSGREPALPVILYGRSLGSGVAAHLATRYPIRGLILETPYLSIVAMGARFFPFFPAFFVRYNINSQKNIKNLKIPILILHGTKDETVPYAQGSQLAKENAAAEFVSFEGGRHNNLATYPQFWPRLEAFVSRVITS